ncbi:MAG: hypothetical protein EPN91_08720 [Salinibacterium sp.]|nr:MAG: hypothetical protein EPN91_08720 [Salinibacterium sp.]
MSLARKLVASDVGALVTYNGANYRVKAWLREWQRPPVVDAIEALIWEETQQLAGKRMQFCSRHAATHVALVGICGAIAPAVEVKVTGRVNWPEEHIEGARALANQLGARGEIVF